jgi:hypothetical protein
MSNIPDAREKLKNVEKDLLKLAHLFIEHKESETIMLARACVLDALDLMHREKHKPVKGEKTATPVNKDIRDIVKQLVIDQPDINTRTVGEMVNINQGRVSEILEGKYDKLS